MSTVRWLGLLIWIIQTLSTKFFFQNQDDFTGAIMCSILTEIFKVKNWKTKTQKGHERILTVPQKDFWMKNIKGFAQNCSIPKQDSTHCFLVS